MTNCDLTPAFWCQTGFLGVCGLDELAGSHINDRARRTCGDALRGTQRRAQRVRFGEQDQSGTVTRQGLDNILSQGSSEQIATTYEADEPSEGCESPTFSFSARFSDSMWTKQQHSISVSGFRSPQSWRLYEALVAFAPELHRFARVEVKTVGPFRKESFVNTNNGIGNEEAYLQAGAMLHGRKQTTTTTSQWRKGKRRWDPHHFEPFEGASDAGPTRNRGYRGCRRTRDLPSSLAEDTEVVGDGIPAGGRSGLELVVERWLSEFGWRDGGHSRDGWDNFVTTTLACGKRLKLANLHWDVGERHPKSPWPCILLVMILLTVIDHADVDNWVDVGRVPASLTGAGQNAVSPWVSMTPGRVGSQDRPILLGAPGLLRYEIPSARLISSSALAIIPLTTYPAVGNPEKPFGCQGCFLEFADSMYWVNGAHEHTSVDASFTRAPLRSAEGWRHWSIEFLSIALAALGESRRLFAQPGTLQFHFLRVARRILNRLTDATATFPNVDSRMVVVSERVRRSSKEGDFQTYPKDASAREAAIPGTPEAAIAHYVPEVTVALGFRVFFVYLHCSRLLDPQLASLLIESADLPIHLIRRSHGTTRNEKSFVIPRRSMYRVVTARRHIHSGGPLKVGEFQTDSRGMASDHKQQVDEFRDSLRSDGAFSMKEAARLCKENDALSRIPDFPRRILLRSGKLPRNQDVGQLVSLVDGHLGGLFALDWDPPTQQFSRADDPSTDDNDNFLGRIRFLRRHFRDRFACCALVKELCGSASVDLTSGGFSNNGIPGQDL
ncbi:hypothetical protein BJ322DRAFT_1216166 [Thelephora terrestris]|uniref:Uncharacterized protein n=1 Tax=Thelephora terrestris TaxID=56493 RepID=A0A9P6HVL4_9AGAM|nr:hypothetical protein BJ322DRAFT_1216166 [Thelephora terrestris]